MVNAEEMQDLSSSDLSADKDEATEKGHLSFSLEGERIWLDPFAW